MSHDISVPPNEADFFDLLKDETRRDAADATRALVRCMCNFVRYEHPLQMEARVLLPYSGVEAI